MLPSNGGITRIRTIVGQSAESEPVHGSKVMTMLLAAALPG
jgi:hypothetical protein